MFCEDYRKPLIYAASSGATLSQALRAHLDSCAACRSAFAEEQALFAAIDSGLRSLANSELPASLLPRVRASFEQESRPNRWYASWKFAGAMGTAVIAGIALLLLQPARVPSGRESIHSPAPLAVAPAQKVSAAAPAISASAGHLRAAPVPPSNTRIALALHAPEVLVSAEERDSLARFASHLQGQPRGLIALATDPSKPQNNDLSISPVEIARLELKALEQSAADR